MTDFIEKFMRNAEERYGRDILFKHAEETLGAARVSIPEEFEDDLDIEEAILVAMEQYDLGFQCVDCGWFCWEHEKVEANQGWICRDCAGEEDED